MVATKFSPMIVDEWSSTLDYLLDRRTEKILEAAKGSEEPICSPLTQLKSIIAVMRMNDSAAPFKDDNLGWMKIEPVAEMLLDIFADPLHFDVAKWIGVGTIVPSSEDIFKEYDLDGGAETRMLSEY
ncbi:hypothetical protein JAAARDRAFT_396657 [Jaapia argillacea MUCL 33604]|uniref:Uncharacterized protein n=1 Tax=Jaapia argillacea MUCL 33604 TaxID=933084 RepID=A0A067PIB9_9AGAM|nr:hypothetical protein JAAARDRAFT_396657 [Jaapia argillacea MUCL 33604]